MKFLKKTIVIVLAGLFFAGMTLSAEAIKPQRGQPREGASNIGTTLKAYGDFSRLCQTVSSVYFPDTKKSGTLGPVTKGLMSVQWVDAPETSIAIPYGDLREMEEGWWDGECAEAKIPKETYKSLGEKIRFVFFKDKDQAGQKYSYSSKDEAANAAHQFVDDFNILAQDPSLWTLSYEDQYDAALKQYHSAHGKLAVPEEARKYFVQAESAFNGKNYGESVKRYYKGLQAAPWYPQAHYNLSILLAEQENDYGDAIVEMKRFIELDPGSPDARAAQDKIYDWEMKNESEPGSDSKNQNESGPSKPSRY